jgi:putative ABC transport system permease protein
MLLKNYLDAAIKSLLKRKGFSGINIAGLAIGITCSLLLLQYVSYEKSYDAYAENKPLYRLRLDNYVDGKMAWQAATCYPITGPYMKRDFPEVESFCRLKNAAMLFSNDEKQVKFNESKGYFADTSVFNLLNVQLLTGGGSATLNGPDKIVLSQAMARRYYGNEDATGRMLTIRDAQMVQHYQVTGVFKNYPANAHLAIDYLISYTTLGKIKKLQGDTTNTTETQWGWYDFYTYIKLKPGTDYKQLESKLPAFCTRYYPDLNWAKMNKAHDELHLLPVKDIHLKSHYYQEAEANGDEANVSTVFLIALVIIAIAWINYINLSTARSVERAKEVGIRKLLGARRGSLVKQFLVEGVLLNSISLVIALIIVFITTPWFNRFVGHPAASAWFQLSYKYILLFVGIFITGTLLSGVYPALVLSGYQPAMVLKGAFKNAAGGLLLRKTLIVVQFATAVILIAGTFIVYRQVNFMRTQNLGFNAEQTMILNGPESVSDSLYGTTYRSFKNKVLGLPGVKAITASSSVMGKEIYWTNDLKREGSTEKTFTMYNLGVDDQFIPAYGMKMIAGRNFSKTFGTDGNAAILNEAAVKQLGFSSPADALNKKVIEGVVDTLTIIGVVADFHHLGLQKAVDPQLLLPMQDTHSYFMIPDAHNYYSVKVTKAAGQETLAAVKTLWGEYFPNDSFNYFFLDEFYNQQYQASVLFGSVVAVFSLLAILVACFGLAGLSAYSILQRTREIGIRKVLGAPISQLLYLLSKDFMLLVFVGFIIAVPVAWWTMHDWLRGFAYHTPLNIGVFAVACLVCGCIALATIVLQALKAATVNPVKSLRNE